MCGSKGFNDACCPDGQIFQETLCGNFNGGTDGVEDLVVWQAPAGDYFEGTFEIFNSASSPTDATGIIATPAGNDQVGPVPPGFSIARSTLNPTQFTITAPAGVNGKFCITLYKRLLA
jgi:hypothetical protein